MSRAPSSTRARKRKSRSTKSGTVESAPDPVPPSPALPEAEATAHAGPSPGPVEGIRVRSACAQDAAAIGALGLYLGRAQESLGGEWALSDGAGERFARSIPAILGNPRSLCLVAEMEIEGSWRPAGFLLAAVKLRSSAYRESVSGEIVALHVAPDATGRGAGTALVGEAFAWMRLRGIAEAETTIPVSDAASAAFWRSVGFRESSTTFRASPGPSPVSEPAPDPRPRPS
jgi:GNAT superfamily N-acetyltransferase